MITEREIAEFFRLALRLQWVTPAAIEAWADGIIASEPKARYPFFELCVASQVPISRLLELLGEVPGSAREFIAGHLAVAVIGRRWRERLVCVGVAIHQVYEIGLLKELPEEEFTRASIADDNFQLATKGIYGEPEKALREVVTFFAQYEDYEKDFPREIYSICSI